MTTMSIEELLVEVARAYEGDEGLTVPEWAGKMQCSELTARRRIHLLMDAGKMKAGKAPRKSPMDGRTFPRPVYRVI